MANEMILYVIILICVMWIGFLTLVCFKIIRQNKVLFSDKPENIVEVLSRLIKKTELNEKSISLLNEKLEKTNSIAFGNLCKIGYVRFSPFERIGADQSFSLSLTNHHDTGIVITFLYTRDGIRVYAKRVKEGKGVEHDLSQEEVDAIKKAL